ncbi:right-handed parallel beta-helix repeat-containing protein [Aquimarina sp. Aq107]|uniref:right-handed parallel beta-helix repeat-containing protein n=1 Tax=Aquimarina sp. Aq107 TaxID=1191912 RepID=UPI000D554C22|nr:right-handed parallel beta-helix repeat-containing protein [Aquimarina sp. Aq107]
MKRKLLFYFGFFLLFFSTHLTAQIVVKNGDNLENVIKNARGGQTIIIESGTYDGLRLDQLKFSRSEPLIVKAKEGNNVIVDAKRNDNRALYLTNSSYLVFEGIKFKGSKFEGILIEESDHIIITNCEIYDSGQAGIKVALRSKYVDILDTKIHDTGTNGAGNRRYGEGIYVGRGGGHNSSNWPDNTEYVWIEDCEIYKCGAGEAIDIKGETFNNTIKDNYIHDITLRDADFPQANEGAISLGHFAKFNGNIHKENTRRNNWVEGNTVVKTRDGANARISGIYSAGLGNAIKNNTVRDVRTTRGGNSNPGYGILLNDFGNAKMHVYRYGNTISDVDEEYRVSGNILRNEDPGNNPHSKQTWYNAGDSTDGEDDIISVTAPSQVNQGQQITLNVEYSSSGDRDLVVDFQRDNGDYMVFDQVRTQVSSGAGALDIILNIPFDVPVVNDDYQIQTYITSRGGSWGDRFDNINRKDVDVIGSNLEDKVISVTAPDQVIQGEQTNVSVNYEASDNRDIIVIFQLDHDNFLGFAQNRVQVSAGSGTIDIPITIPSDVEVSNDSYQFQTILTPRDGSWNNRLDNVDKIDIDVVSQLEDKIVWVNNPESLKVGDDLNVTVNYSASIDRDIIVIFQLDHGDFRAYTEKRVQVSAGSATIEVPLTIPLDVPVANDAYQFQTILATRDGHWEERKDNLTKVDIDIFPSSRISENVDTFPETEFKILKNPISDNVLQLSGPKRYSIKIYDISGKEVFKSNKLENNVTLDLRLNKGFYLVNMINTEKNSIVSKKILVQ